METTTAFNYQDFSEYLSDIEAQVSPRQVLTDINGVLTDVEASLDSYNETVTGADEETKRQLAMSTVGAYNLNLLSQDENFNVRILALCNPAASPTVLDQAVDDSPTDKYILMIVANNPSASLPTLNKIFDFGGEELEIRTALLANPNTDDILRFKIDSSKSNNAEQKSTRPRRRS